MGHYDEEREKYMPKSQEKNVLQELHDGPTGGHYAGDATTHKILRASYYWRTLFKYAHSYMRRCQVCQTTTGRQKKPSFLLQPVNIDQPFEQWGLDVR